MERKDTCISADIRSGIMPIEDPVVLSVKNTPCTFGQKITSIEKNNAFTRAYNVAGIKIKCEEEFKNRTQKMRLHFYGSGCVLDKKVSFDETINIDTYTYNRYDWSVKNGILYVTLYEKINPRPDFKRVEKESKKADSKEDKSNVEKM